MTVPLPPAEALAKRAAEWAFALVSMPSVTGSADEAAFGYALQERIATSPAFARAGGRVWTIPLNDAPGRVCVAALLRGNGPATVVLTGHYDTVRIDDYGLLAPLALQPLPLRDGLIERLSAANRGMAEGRALEDFRSGAFLPGRGLLDMKSGLGAGLAVLEEFAAAPQRIGNLLFLAVPDEEANSAGARCAAAALPGIARDQSIRLDAAINLDSLVDDGEGKLGRSVALGTIGKLLPSALVVGEPVHASNALAGLNAGALAAEIIAGMEWATELTDRTGEELGPPPTLLGVKDSRTAYDVTTPDHVWIYWNVMTHRRGPEEVLSSMRALCVAAASRVRARLQARAAALGATARLGDEPPVITFSELRADVLGRSPEAVQPFEDLARDAAERGLDLPDQCRLLTEHLWLASGRAGPAIVIGFASLPYLPTSLRGQAGGNLEAAVRLAAAGTARRHGVSIGVSQVFPGISDMSFLGQTDLAAIPFVGANTPAWGSGIDWPAEGGGAGLPIVNAGPWGRDYHTPLERLHTGYAFDVLPELLLAIVQHILQPATGSRETNPDA